jgi:hypothetical protein
LTFNETLIAMRNLLGKTILARQYHLRYCLCDSEPYAPADR